MKWLTAKNSLLLSLVGLCFSLVMLSAANTQAASDVAEQSKSGRTQLQMGFYDLLSQQKEVYDARLSTTQGGYIGTITNPNDNRFIFKGKFSRQVVESGQSGYHYSPIFFNNPTSGKMIDGFLDYLTHNTIFMTPMEVNGQPLLVGQSGIVLGDK
ncbi:hypothetical protein [Yersinia alsatica]|uniref:hypothetical protein n=1 Tax=Yersinia alsatica TaxID=2890317 RepID=UPI001643E20A|nr:hypothetical protein [Yersinia alsatica]